MNAAKKLLNVLLIGLCITTCAVIIKFCFNSPEFAVIPRPVLGAIIGATVAVSGLTTVIISKLHDKNIKAKEKKLNSKFEKIEEKLLANENLSYQEQKIYDKYVQTKGKKLKSDIKELDTFFNEPAIKKSGLYCMGTVENENTTHDKVRNFVTKDWQYLISKLKHNIYYDMNEIESNRKTKSSQFVGSFLGDYNKVNLQNDFWADNNSLKFAKQNMSFDFRTFTFYSREQGEALLKFINEYNREIVKNTKKMPTPVSKIKVVTAKPKRSKEAICYQEDER